MLPEDGGQEAGELTLGERNHIIAAMLGSSVEAREPRVRPFPIRRD